MLSRQAKLFFSGRLFWTSIALCALCNFPAFGQSPEKELPVWKKPSPTIPSELLRAYVSDVTKVGHQLGAAYWSDETKWLVVEVILIDDDKLTGSAPFPGGGVYDFFQMPNVGFIALHIPSRKLKFLPPPTLTSNKWRISPYYRCDIWPDGNLAITTVPTAKSSDHYHLIWKWNLTEDRVSLVGKSIVGRFHGYDRSVPSLIAALDGTGFSLDWPEFHASDWNRRLRLKQTCGEGSTELALEKAKYKEYTRYPNEMFLPGSGAKELINFKEAPLGDGQMIRCLELGSTVREKWKLTPQRIAEVTGESNPSIGVPEGLARPCNRIPLMIGNKSKAKIWILDTKTGKLTTGWSHPTFSIRRIIRTFGVASVDGKLLAVEAKYGFHLFQVDTGKILYRPGDTDWNLYPAGIDKQGKVIATSGTGVWTLEPPYSKAPKAIFRLKLPPQVGRN